MRDGPRRPTPRLAPTCAALLLAVAGSRALAQQPDTLPGADPASVASVVAPSATLATVAADPMPASSVASAGSPAAPTVPPAQVAAPPRRLLLVGTFGYDYGFHELLTAHYKDGGTARVGANGGFGASIGAAWLLVPSGAYELRATAGLKWDDVSASNGEAYYLAFPVELLVAWNLRPLRLSTGASLSLGPRLRGSGVLADAQLDLRDSLGAVGQLEWVRFSSDGVRSWSMGLRYLWQKLEPSAGGRAVDASALGVVFVLSL